MTLDSLWDVVKRIPPGRAMSYGEVGRALKNPASGRMVGRWMAQCPDGVPWWRVVDRNGCFPIGKKSPLHEKEQEQLLREEGAVIENGRVSPAVMLPFDELTTG